MEVEAHDLYLRDSVHEKLFQNRKRENVGIAAHDSRCRGRAGAEPDKQVTQVGRWKEGC